MYANIKVRIVTVWWTDSNQCRTYSVTNVIRTRGFTQKLT